jgi:hypothetical protein
LGKKFCYTILGKTSCRPQGSQQIIWVSSTSNITPDLFWSSHRCTKWRKLNNCVLFLCTYIQFPVPIHQVTYTMYSAVRKFKITESSVPFPTPVLLSGTSFFCLSILPTHSQLSALPSAGWYRSGALATYSAYAELRSSQALGFVTPRNNKLQSDYRQMLYWKLLDM